MRHVGSGTALASRLNAGCCSLSSEVFLLVGASSFCQGDFRRSSVVLGAVDGDGERVEGRPYPGSSGESGAPFVSLCHLLHGPLNLPSGFGW